MTEPSKTPRTDALTSWDWIQGEHAMTQLEGHYQRLKDLAGELEVSLSETQSARGRLAHEVDQWRAFGQSLTGVDANDCGWLRAEMESQWRKKEDYAELNLRWRRYGERLQLAMLELEERTRPDGDMADAPVNALVKNALLDAFDAYQPGSESEIDSKTPTGGAHGEQAKMEVPGDAAGPATGRDEPDDGLAADDGVAGRDGRGGVGVRGLRPSVVAREGNAAGLVDLPQASVVPGHAVDTGFPNAEQRRYLIELLRAAKCPEPRCTDGSIISTGPDPQNDACQWCYQRHVTIEALQEGHSQGKREEPTP